MKSKSIRYYYFTSITTVLIASVLVMGLIQTYLATDYFRREKESLLGQITQSVAKGVREGQLDLSGESIFTLDYMTEISGTEVFLVDVAGRIGFSAGANAPAVGDYVGLETLGQLNRNLFYNELGHLGGLYQSNYYTSGRRLYDSAGNPVGYVFASADATGRQVYLMDTMSTFILSATLVLLFSSLVALGLTNRTVIPIRRVSEAARRFAEGDYSARVPVQGDDELAQLAITFNEMANAFESADLSRRNFMGNIAHELRTPMTSIKGFIDGMLDGTIPVEQRDRYLTVVSDEVGRLARLTKNMLDVSRLEAGEYTPNIVSFDIWEPLTSVFLGAEQRLDDKCIEVRGLERQGPAQVLADEDFIHQVLYNLVDNAIKFTGEHGTITASVDAGKAYVTVSIHNTGTGIDEESLPHVFDRFYKADKSRGVNARGSGLGLHISKVLVGLMGGRIWAESEEGAWTEFSFTLPAAPPKARKGRTGQETGRINIKDIKDIDTSPE